MLSDDDRESVASDVSSLLSSEISYSHRAGAGAVLEESGGAGDSFNEIMERLSEKRTSTREGALRELCSGLRSYALAEQAAANRETAVASVLGLVKRAGPTEGVLCCDALALLLLLLGPEEDEIFGQVVPPLEFLITRSRYEDVRIEVCGGVDGRVGFSREVSRMTPTHTHRIPGGTSAGDGLLHQLERGGGHGADAALPVRPLFRQLGGRARHGRTQGLLNCLRGWRRCCFASVSPRV